MFIQNASHEKGSYKFCLEFKKRLYKRTGLGEPAAWSEI